YILATADGIISSENKGLEIKMVGRHMVKDWDKCPRGTVPLYVEMQCRQNMAVYNKDKWDVFACLGGTSFEKFTVPRNDKYEKQIIDLASDFSLNYVMKDVPPPETNPDALERLIAALYPKS